MAATPAKPSTSARRRPDARRESARLYTARDRRDRRRLLPLGANIPVEREVTARPEVADKNVPDPLGQRGGVTSLVPAGTATRPIGRPDARQAARIHQAMNTAVTTAQQAQKLADRCHLVAAAVEQTRQKRRAGALLATADPRNP